MNRAGEREVEALTPSIVAYLHRESTRRLVSAVFPKRRYPVVFPRTLEEFDAAMRATLVDLVLVDMAQPTETSLRVASLAREYPSAPFIGLLPARTTHATILAQCLSFDFAEFVFDGMDEVAIRELVVPLSFTARFAAAFQTPPEALVINTPLRLAAWHVVVSRAGRPVRTDEVADALAMSREHLSRAFSDGGAPNLKRVIDLVRLCAAAELSKNPAYDVADVARVLEFASSSHLSTASQRVTGTKPAALARLRTVDILDRFLHGRTRSRTLPFRRRRDPE